MNNDNKVETAIAGLNCWAGYATEYNCMDFAIIADYSIYESIERIACYMGEHLKFRRSALDNYFHLSLVLPR